MTDQGPTPRSTKEAFGGKTVALFAVPGAFTPTCHMNHLPSFLAQADALRAKGVDEIACVSINDVFVLDAWAKATTAKSDIQMLADGSGDFTKAIDMELDLTERGLGVRSKRYAMLVEDGTVKQLLVEDNPGEAVKSTADALLAAM
ncbi:UNVERIFIED_CONTAM: hypothetical protein GTU68_035453 [Idotea baltica]|nr:hypothetical protein [Idotea baltica]